MWSDWVFPCIVTYFYAGFSKNWWVGLSILHNLFTREHNLICDMLLKNHPDWEDDRLFQTARYESVQLASSFLVIGETDWVAYQCLSPCRLGFKWPEVTEEMVTHHWMGY